MEVFNIPISLNDQEIQILKRFSRFYEDIDCSDISDVEKEAIYKLFKWGIVILDEKTNTIGLSESGKLVWNILRTRTEEIEKVQAEEFVRKQQLEEFERKILADKSKNR